MADGWITIGTDLDTKKFEQQVADLEKKIQREEQKSSLKLEAKVLQENKLKEQRQELERISKELSPLIPKAERYTEILQKLRGGRRRKEVSAAEYQEFKNLEDIMPRYNELSTKLLKGAETQQKLELSVKRMNNDYQNTVSQVDQYRQKLENVKLQRQVSEANRLKQGFNDVGNSIQGALRKVTKLALGIFSIRSAFLFLRRASSDLAGYDEQYAANLEYIKYALTQAIAPVLRYVVNLASKLLAYINAILQAWFGINLFSNASAESFNKMKSSAGGISSAVKEIKKQLTGFDEINMLTDQSDTGTSSGLGGVGVGPEFDLAQNIEIPEWLKWLIRNKDVILTLITAMAGWKVGSSILEFLSRIGIVKDLGGSLKILAGLTLMITGVTISYGSVKNMLEGDLSAENLLKGIGGAGLAGIGAGLLFGGPVGWTVAIALALVVFITWVFKKQEEFNKTLAKGLGVDYDGMNFTQKLNWNLDFSLKWLGLREASEEEAAYMDKIKEEIQKQLQEIGENIDKFFKDMIRQGFQFGIDLITGFYNGLSDEAKAKINYIYTTFVKPFLDKIRELFGIHSPSTVMQKIGEYVVDGFVNGIKGIWDKVSGIFTNLLNQITNIIERIKMNFQLAFDNIKNGFQTVFNKASEVWQGIQNVFSRVGEFFQRTFGDAWENVKRIFTSGGSVFEGIKEGITYTFTNIVNELIYGINRIIVEPFREINRALSGIRYTEIMGFQPFAWLPYIDIPQLPYLRTGAIVNMPNKGTTVGGGMALAGESGREGVIPLTDRQAMEELGRSIGKYITINANITNTMNGRVISRQLKQIQDEQNFAYNT